MKTAPAWINREMYPFESKWFDSGAGQMHYIDEGAGDALLFVHGCPEWSFGYRDVVKNLSSSHRCIVIDHLGFGLSDKPPGAAFSVKAHSDRLTRIIQHLDLKNVTLVANDFGGGIGLGYAVNNPHNIAGILLFNSWCWSLKNDPHFSMAGKLVKTWLMKLFYLRFNFSVNVVMPSAYGDKKKLTREVHDHYKRVVPDADSRIGIYAIARELVDASDWWEQQWGKMEVLAGKPVKIFWGMKDSAVPARLIDRWKEKFPLAEVIKVPAAGHFVQEEEPLLIADGIRSLVRNVGRLSSTK